MTENENDTKVIWTDADDAPELTDDWFEGATLHEGGAVKRLPGQRGPGKKPPKEVITLRLDAEILQHFRQTGDGWQTRINSALKTLVTPEGAEDGAPTRGRHTIASTTKRRDKGRRA